MNYKTKIYTVSEVNYIIQAVLEANLPDKLTVTGEITDWKIHTSGHCYFSLKDENSKLPCVMWAARFNYLRFRPENGMAVIAKGNIDVYPPGGKYQFYVESLQPEGIGALQLAFEQMYKRLKAEGLFEDKYKKPLPPYPMRIGVLTSESGAAIHDIADSIRNRWPCAKLFLYPVPVQGKGAAEEIASALKDVNKRNDQLKLDVLIVGRGGGSLEDLWAFNEEVLARAIFDSKIPVISAVGHEIDTTIADLVADARASTPTKAGVTAVPDMDQVLEQLSYLQESLYSQLRMLIQNGIQQSDELQLRLAGSVRELLARIKSRLYEADRQIRTIEPHRLLKDKTIELADLKNRINTAANRLLNNCRIQLTAQLNRLAGLNPKSVLNRGYSITINKKTGDVIRNIDDINIKDYIITELAGENLVESQVTKK